MNPYEIIVLLFGVLFLAACDKKKSLETIISEGTGGTTTVPTPPPPGQPVKTKNIVVAGQSNGLGIPAPAFDPDPNVTMEGGPLSGPGFPFAVQMADTESIKVTVIQCSVDGSGMDTWAYRGSNYQACIQRVGSRKVDALLFVQGEAEAQIPNAYAWAAAFANLISNFRALWGNIPVIYVQLGLIASPPWNVPNLQHIQDEQAAAETGTIRMIVPPNELPGLDGLHRTPDQNRVIGYKMYQVYQTFTHA